MPDFTNKKELERYNRLQLPCRRCQTVNWYKNLNDDKLCPFCADIERVNKYFKKLEKAEDSLREKSGKYDKQILKRREMYISSLDELKNEVDSMSSEEKKQVLRDLGFDNYYDIS
ncbi:hypothetical protein LCGC14_1208240 [marine sediment metagenome]|uniref:Uncharacterized protein n=1 Tax=marine sediment metagenome TaxID=412755 RepID=A0A0F9PJI8_9ZZZZ